MIRAIITDIEGTTTDIRFVHQILFPYARERLGEFLRSHQEEPEVAAALDALRAEIDRPQANVEALIETLYAYMDGDVKSTPLKVLQGIIWRSGYENGDFRGHLYPDVAPQLKSWHQQNLRLGVYSSGSVEPQTLLFGYSDESDLTPLFSDYFDTRIDAKRETESYQNIAAQLILTREDMLFLSDIRQELDAARLAGWHTCQLIRGDADTLSDHPQVNRFDQIALETFLQEG